MGQDVVKKRTRSKLTKEQTDIVLNEIQRELISHNNQYAILLVKEGREMIPYFVKIEVSKYGSISAKYKCYTSDGKFRCYLGHTPNPIDIFTGTQKIVYLDKI